MVAVVTWIDPPTHCTSVTTLMVSHGLEPLLDPDPDPDPDPLPEDDPPLDDEDPLDDDDDDDDEELLLYEDPLVLDFESLVLEDDPLLDDDAPQSHDRTCRILQNVSVVSDAPYFVSCTASTTVPTGAGVSMFFCETRLKTRTAFEQSKTSWFVWPSVTASNWRQSRLLMRTSSPVALKQGVRDSVRRKYLLPFARRCMC